jgi:DNA-binding NarL/FixJ family response regulator
MDGHRRGRRHPGTDLSRQSLLDTLTPREREVLGLMAEGCSNQAICERLVLSPKTVEAHIRSVLTKLDLPPAAGEHRRVLAVLTYLRAS